ncbi:glutamine--fructose-6-phosphate aminotransferase [Candidatus Gottesmanbacteria bacterium RIFOXYB1_FULL_47_11]|uniref:Glutamine--fructose-6-phosphate aminotransferase [isomerizing] n=1 Tax=Candidatus Gottesmanbacteria bacterium RIFOXYB1_FULL_47_11 TaxID=1798401 RepID=A0A1F6BDZ2_9BACT|nr:MAG: glutamine--fructose-6-phosphate aminotransferase [Candidatus Gottesmanbacteria bacterium RIFOXYB1_FULL_47_11]
MCGIFGYVGKKTNAAEIVLAGLKRLEYRGYDSWGVAAVSKNKIFVKKKIGKIGSATVEDLPASTLALGHTRWATHGGVTDQNAHPHADCSGTIALIHNGIFENYEEYKVKLLKLGHRFTSDTDTEVIVHLIEEYAQSMPLTDAVEKAFKAMHGLNAIIVLSTKLDTFIAIRNGSPLVLGFSGGENFLASDPAALLPHTKTVYFLGDNEMAIVGSKTAKIRNIQTGKTVRAQKQTLTWDIHQAEKGNYRDFMSKEIHEQSGIIADIAASGTGLAQRIAAHIKKTPHLYLVGCGSASYAAIAGEYLFSKIAGRHANIAIGSEFGYHLDFLTRQSVVIAISQSGETMDILESVKKAKAKGAQIYALVNVLGSTLYREATEKILIGAGPEKSVASTKALTGMLSQLTLLAYALAGKPEEGTLVLTLAAKSVKTVLEKTQDSAIRKLAGKLKHVQHIYTIGRGLSYPAALEAAMKIKEISYIHAEGLAAGELKHGPLALVTRGTPCIAFLPDDETYGANLAGAMEMKARGGFVIGVSHKPHEVFDEYINVQDAGPATIIPNVVVAQLLAYYLTLARGLDPDMPRNLAKSVTVK